MRTDPGQTSGVFWEFCLELYAKPGVADACLALQGRFGTNVPLLMCAAWLGVARVRLAAVDVDRLASAVGAWQSEVVEPLRRIRTGLKQGPPPARSVATDALREQIKALELQAERIEIDYLQSLTAALAPCPRGVPRLTVAANMNSILGLHANGDSAARLLDVIGNAAVRIRPNSASGAVLPS